MFAFRDHDDLGPGSPGGTRVEVAFTDATLDLHEEHDSLGPALSAVGDAAGVPFVRLHQVHGAEVAQVDDPVDVSVVPDADAVVTAVRGIGLMVRVADCVPVLLADPGAGVIGAVHAGRRGLALDVVGRAAERMRALGADHLRAWVGPHVCGRCYEVPEEMQREVAAAVPAARSETSWGTPALDLGAGVAAQLAGAGASVVHVDRCTLEDARLHSHRRDGGSAGRFAGLVWTA